MPIYPKIIKKSTSDEMGAIDQATVGSRNHVRIKSASVESNQLPNIICSSCQPYEHEEEEEDDDDDDHGPAATAKRDNDRASTMQPARAPTMLRNKRGVPQRCKTASQDSLVIESNQRPLTMLVAPEAAQQPQQRGAAAAAPASKTRSFLSPFGRSFTSSSAALSPSKLRPSVSTSCLFSDCNDDVVSSASTSLTLNKNQHHHQLDASSEPGKSSSGQASNTSLVCVPTRASLTHEWRKLKTPNNCRECNLLVYFNGRECSCCGFVAHKKCLMVLVIKCSGQRPAPPGRCRDDDSPGRSAMTQFFSRNSSSILLGGRNKERQGGGGGGGDKEAKANHKDTSRNRSLWLMSYAQKAANQNTVNPIFGRPVVEADSEQVLDFINRFIYEIDTRGLTSKGIYRVSSIKSKVDKLCNYFDQNLSSLIDLSSFHPNIIANALKMYLRRLPEPLLTLDLYQHFIEIAKKYSTTQPTSSSSPAQHIASCPTTSTPHHAQVSVPVFTGNRKSKHKTAVLLTNHHDRYDPNVMIDEFRQVTRLLPPLNHDIVAMILRHLRRVADMAEENQMSAKNLSIIFGPTLLSPANNKSLAIADNIHQARVVELMITWAYQIFPQ